MYPSLNAQSSETFAARKKQNDLNIFPNPRLAAYGFNIWLQKTAAQNMAMVVEASDLMRAHRLANRSRQSRAPQAH